jgi:16S rRNA (uracil1498-N3)-methyltransferase
MRVEPPVAWERFLREPGLPMHKAVLHPRNDSQRAAGFTPAGLPAPDGDVIFAIGPEGGFTDEEVTAAASAGWRSQTLGPRILRIETAAIASAALAVNSPSFSAPVLPL